MKKFRHDISRRKEGAVIISTKDGEIKKCTGSKAKKHAATLIVGKDISLSEVLEYLSLALVGRFCSKTVNETALQRWMQENWSPHLRQLPVFHILSRGWIFFRVKTEVER